MTDDAGNLSIDFLAGFTIFMIAFIYVATLVPSLFIGLQSRTIDYDAVAYRTGVILVEDPGMPYNPSWETKTDAQKYDVLRFGLAVSKDTPNILSQAKVNRFFCSTWSSDDYRSRAIFGDYPYSFNIAIKKTGDTVPLTVGDTIPDDYGYIRRVVELKGTSNATIGISSINAYNYYSVDNVSSDVFSIHLNFTNLLSDVTNPAYQINPYTDQIMINITNPDTKVTPPAAAVTTLSAIQICRIKPIPPTPTPPPVCFSNFSTPIIDNIPVFGLPYPIKNNVSIIIPPGFITTDMADANTQLYFNLTFNHYGANGAPSLEKGYLNSTVSGPFNYNYDPVNVTLPKLQDGVLEVAVWSGGAITQVSPTTTYPLTGVSITYTTPQVGSTLTAALTPSAATATYQWLKSATSGGTYTAISGATSSTYSPVAGDVGYYIEVVATGSGSYSGSVTSTAVGPITTPITAVSISGTVAVNSILTAAVTPSGATATYQWQESATSSGTYTAISGATSSTYSPVAGDVGHYIEVVATGSGSYIGTVTSAAVGPVPSSDTTLSGLTVSQGTLSPTFASSTVTYTDSVANSVTSMTVTPTVNTAGATVKVNGNTVASGSASSAISLSVGSNTITVVVTAPDGTTTQNYVITVTRATAATAITSAGVTGFVAPAKGATPEVVGSLVSGAPTQYTVTSLTWSPTDSPYKASTVYTATVVLTSATGYTFSTAITPTVNTGTPSSGTVTGTGSGNTLTFTVTFPATAATTITTAAISGVTAPVAGATPVTTIADNGQYSGTITWSGSPSTFAAGTTYTATITLTADSGYTFTGVTANFFTVAGSTSATNPVNSGVVTAAFPKTATTVTTKAISGVTAPVAGATPVTTIAD
ncbi:cadherin-like beta sandwich domain-containing protein, partial [Methanoregula sp.]|uniref:DUF7287 family protein n=1 Tax=Methanoregula sp. TaxID=2052170 RepID=UPI0025D39D5F